MVSRIRRLKPTEGESMLIFFARHNDWTWLQHLFDFFFSLPCQLIFRDSSPIIICLKRVVKKCSMTFFFFFFFFTGDDDWRSSSPAFSSAGVCIEISSVYLPSCPRRLLQCCQWLLDELTEWFRMHGLSKTTCPSCSALQILRLHDYRMEFSWVENGHHITHGAWDCLVYHHLCEVGWRFG